MEGSPLRLALLAVAVGGVADLGAVVFRALIALFHNLFFLGELSFSGCANAHTQVLAFGCLPESQCTASREAEHPVPGVAFDVIP